jgi:lincosamide nucleotidyltransferase
MIARVKHLCREDDAVVAAMMYGSFALGGGDRYSDIEFVIFFKDEALETLDKGVWLTQVAPVALHFTNEYGVTAVIFCAREERSFDDAQGLTLRSQDDNAAMLVRGEFHFDKVSELPHIAATWPGEVWFPTLEDTLIVDKTGILTPYLRPLIGSPLEHGQTSAEVQTLVNRFFNWYLFGLNVLARGEHARALELLWFVQRHLLLMARILEGTTTHWHIPSRALEEDLSPEAYARYEQCTAPLNASDLYTAYRHAWTWATDMLKTLDATYDLTVPSTLLKNLQARVERSHLLGSESSFPEAFRKVQICE